MTYVYSCDDGDIYWFDNCEVRQSLKENCSVSCSGVTDVCVGGSVCGDGIIGGTEICDGTNLSEQSCVSQNYDSGSLGCSLDCLSFNVSGCVLEGEVFYVSVNGAGNRNGSLGNEMTLAQAISYANAHTSEEIIFEMEEGNYGIFEIINPTERTMWVTWKGNGPVVLNHLQISSTFHRFINITLIETTYPDVIEILNSDYVELINIEIIGNGYIQNDGSTGIYFENSKNLRIDGCSIHGLGGSETGFWYAIYGGHSNFTQILNCNITDSGYGVLAWGYNWDIKNNHIYDMDSDGIVGVGNTNLIIRDNYTVSPHEC